LVLPFFIVQKDGILFNALAVSAVILGGIITYCIHVFTKMDMDNAVGLMSGAVTNTPGLGAAKSTLQEIQTKFTTRQFNDPAIAYAITYPLGVFGIIISIIFSKYILKIDLVKEGLVFTNKANDDATTIIHEKCRITNEDLVGKSIYQIFKQLGTQNIIISRLKTVALK